MAFVDLDDSFEKFCQAVRRCYRFGQKRQVQVHLFTAENEGQILANLKRKEEAHHEMSASMIEHMKDIMNTTLAGQVNIVDEYKEDTIQGDGFTIHLGDCVKWTRRMDDNSIDYSVFSPPFADLFVYSNSDHDMGNCKDDAEFGAVEVSDCGTVPHHQAGPECLIPLHESADNQNASRIHRIA